MVKKVLENFKLSEGLLSGAKKARDIITSTMGPGGRFVCVSSGMSSTRVTKDGATVAKNFNNLQDPIESIGADWVTNASKQMGDKVGDGSTTVVSLLYKMMEEATNLRRSGFSPRKISKALDIVKDEAKEIIEKIAKQVSPESKEMEYVATIAANGDQKIGKMLSNAFAKIGRNGMIVVDESKTGEDFIDIIDGFSFDRGPASPNFFKPNELERSKIEMVDVKILISEKKFSALTQKTFELFNKLAANGQSILIVADDFETAVIETFVINRVLANKLNAVCVKAPGFGDRRRANLEDLASICGATPILEMGSVNFENIEIEHLGSAKKVLIQKDSTTVIGGLSNEEEKNIRIASIKNQLKEVSSEYEKEKLQERMARMSNGIGRFSVGGYTDTELSERKDRIDDAINACYNALMKGIVPGGGVEFLFAAYNIQKKHKDDLLVKRLSVSLHAPFIDIVKNAGDLPVDLAISRVMEKFSNGNCIFGFDLSSDSDQLVSLNEAGIINPSNIANEAIDNATSRCKLFVNLDGCIYEEKEDKKDVMMPNPYDM